MTMFEQLKQYYIEKGISAEHFSCHLKDGCSQGCEDRFVEATEAYLGSKYEENELPRVLFLSLDPGRAKFDIRTRVMSHEEGCDPRKLEKETHWYETHELAWTFLRKFKPDLQFKNVCPYFAHTNSAKCCMNNRGMEMAKKILFNNCRGYIPSEIEVLDPDILITQGSPAKWAIEYGFSNHREEISIDPDCCSYHRIGINNKTVPWFHSTHPSPRNRNSYRFQKSACFEKWSEEAYQYLSYHGWGK